MLELYLIVWLLLEQLEFGILWAFLWIAAGVGYIMVKRDRYSVNISDN